MRQRSWLAAAALCIAASLASCGKKEVLREDQAPANAGGPQTLFPGNPGNGWPGDPGSGGWDPNAGPAMSFNASGTGTGSWTSPLIDTDNLLKVRLQPGQAGNISIPGYSNFNGNYSCINWSIGITSVGATRTTKTLAVNGGSFACSGAPSEDVIDLSPLLTPGHGKVSITMKNARYDFYCVMCYYYYYYVPSYMNPFAPYGCQAQCPLKTVYSSHTWNAVLDVQVNGSQL